MKSTVLKALVSYELAGLWRTPAFTIPGLLLPVMCFGLFGAAQADERIAGVSAAQYLLVSFSTFAIMSVGLFAFGVSVAAERESGWSKLIRLAPLRTWTHLAARLLVTGQLAFLSVSLLLLYAAICERGSVSLELLITIDLLILPGVVTFSALGLAIGYLCPANAAAFVSNVIFVSLSFASGLFVPLEALPRVFQSIAPMLPSYHLAAIGWSRLAGNHVDDLSIALVMLTGFAASFALLAQWAYQREEAREFE